MSLFNRNELRRLEKAAKEKDKQKLIDWGMQFEQQVSELYRIEFENVYQNEMQSSISILMTAIAYSLAFSEEVLLNKDSLPGFMEDLFVTIDLFRTGEYKPEDYEKELKDNGFQIDVYDYSKIYKDRTQKYDELIKEYLTKLQELNKNEDKSA